MKTPADFLDELQVHFGVASDYKLSKKTGWSHTRISNYRTGYSTFDDEATRSIADWLEYQESYVATCMMAVRAKDPRIRKMWEKAAKALAGSAAALLVGCTILAAGSGGVDITHGIAHYAGQAAVLNIHYAHLPPARGLLAFLMLCALLPTAWARICSGKFR